MVADGAQRSPVVSLTFRYSAEQRDEALMHGIAISQDVALGQKGDRDRSPSQQPRQVRFTGLPGVHKSPLIPHECRTLYA